RTLPSTRFWLISPCWSTRGLCSGFERLQNGRLHLEQQQLTERGNWNVVIIREVTVLISDLTAQRGRTTRKGPDAADRRNRRRARLGGREPRRAPCCGRRAWCAACSRPQVAGRGR